MATLITLGVLAGYLVIVMIGVGVLTSRPRHSVGDLEGALMVTFWPITIAACVLGVVLWGLVILGELIGKKVLG